MATEKVFLPIIALLFFNFTIKENYHQNKYTQTSNNFLDTNSVNLIGINDAIDYVIQLSEGDVTKAERKFKKEIPIYKVDVIAPGGGSVEVEMSALDKSLIRIDAKEGPFEYEIKPDKNFVSFSEAKKTAELSTGQKTLKWNYFRNKNNWEYNFWLFLKSGKAQVRIDAQTGDVVSSKKKK